MHEGHLRHISNETFSILDMFWVLRESYEMLKDEEKAELDESDISFQGFDSNDPKEAGFYKETRYLFFVRGIHPDFKYHKLTEPLMRFSNGGNSHRPNLERYRRMNYCFSHIWKKGHHRDWWLFSLAEIKRVVAAGSQGSSS